MPPTCENPNVCAALKWVGSSPNVSISRPLQILYPDLKQYCFQTITRVLFLQTPTCRYTDEIRSTTGANVVSYIRTFPQVLIPCCVLALSLQIGSAQNRNNGNGNSSGNGNGNNSSTGGGSNNGNNPNLVVAPEPGTVVMMGTGIVL
jgi:uncharacterized membrane protein YgcG